MLPRWNLIFCGNNEPDFAFWDSGKHWEKSKWKKQTAWIPAWIKACTHMHAHKKYICISIHVYICNTYVHI